MSTVADKLRQAREARSLTVYQVADTTKIRTDHIRALEQGNFDVFSAPVYIRGFVRTYATLLKLDVAQTMSELEAELARTEKFRDPPPLTDQRNGLIDFVMLQLSRLDWRKSAIGLGVIAVAVVVVFAVMAWRHTHARNPLQNLPPAVYQAPSHAGGDTLPVPQPAQHR